MTVSLALAKAHCRVTSSAEDTLITQYLNASIAWVENYTRKKLTASSAVTQTFAAWPGDPYAFTLTWGPTIASPIITYTDENGDAQTISTGQLVGDKLYPPLDTEWPTIEDNSVISIAYTAGYSAVPADLDNAVLLLVGEYYDNRTAGMASSAVSKAVESLCEPHRLPTLR
jgi:uncharacterized phiE125 gp8 family phage protein